LLIQDQSGRIIIRSHHCLPQGLRNRILRHIKRLDVYALLHRPTGLPQITMLIAHIKGAFGDVVHPEAVAVYGFSEKIGFHNNKYNK
jgi:hypothetical protein